MSSFHVLAAGIALSLFFAPAAQADVAADKAALRALSHAYGENWEKGDADSLMALLTPDVTAVPHHGVAPVVGRKVLRAYWFPEDGPPTVVPEYRLEPSEIIVEGGMGVVRGRFRLVFEYGGVRTTISDGNYIHIAKRTPEGWKLRMITWNDDPRDWVREKIE